MDKTRVCEGKNPVERANPKQCLWRHKTHSSHTSLYSSMDFAPKYLVKTQQNTVREHGTYRYIARPLWERRKKKEHYNTLAYTICWLQPCAVRRRKMSPMQQGKFPQNKNVFKAAWTARCGHDSTIVPGLTITETRSNEILFHVLVTGRVLLEGMKIRNSTTHKKDMTTFSQFL